jgi:hypothetical protein
MFRGIKLVLLVVSVQLVGSVTYVVDCRLLDDGPGLTVHLMVPYTRRVRSARAFSH